MEGDLNDITEKNSLPDKSTKPKIDDQDPTIKASETIMLDCRDDLVTKLGLRKFYESRCRPYIGENPQSKLKPTYTTWVQDLPGPHETSPDSYLKDLVMAPEVEITPDLFQVYDEESYAKMIDLRPGEMPEFDKTQWVGVEKLKKAAPVEHIPLPLPTLIVPPEPDVVSPKYSSDKEELIDVDDSMVPSEKKSKKKKKKRKHEKDNEGGEEKKKKKKKKAKKAKSERYGSDEE